MEILTKLSPIFRLVLFLLTLPVFGLAQQFPVNNQKIVQGVGTTAQGITSYSSLPPTVNPATTTWRHVTSMHVDTVERVQYIYKRPRWYATSLLVQSNPPPATESSGSTTVDYTETIWQNTTDSTSYYYEEKQQCWQPVGTVVRDTTPVSTAATGTSAAVCYEYSLWYNSTNDSLYAYTAGAWLAIGSGGGGTAGAVDSISVLQDSIIVGYSEGSEVTRDTIGYPVPDISDIPGLADSLAAAPSGTGTNQRVVVWTGTNSQGNSTQLQSAAGITLDANLAYRITGGTTASRPTGAAGMMYWNTSNTWWDYHNGTAWFNPARAATTTGLFTAGSVLFAHSDGTIQQDNANLFFDDINNRLGIGTSSPNQQLEITGNLRLPATTATAGIFYRGADRFLHSFGTSNTFLGQNSGNLTLSGADQNTAVGATALDAITSGDDNVAVGFNALGANASTSRNVAIGSGALAVNIINNNVAVGSLALTANTVGADNVGVGRNAITANTTGGSNTAVGNSALATNIDGNQNTAVGHEALNASTLSSNTGVGYRAGRVTTGNFNTFLGWQAGLTTTTGSNNVAIGNAFTGNTTGSFNTAIGNLSLGGAGGTLNTAIGYESMFTSGGSNNTAIGARSLKFATAAVQNIAIGQEALENPTTPQNSIAIGFQALENASNTIQDNIAIGYQALRTATGSNNVAIGSSMLGAVTSGFNNVGIGRNSMTGFTTGYQNIGIGVTAIQLLNGNDNIGIGSGTYRYTVTGNNNIAVGSFAMSPVVSGSSNIAIGVSAGTVVVAGAKPNNKSTNSSIFIGESTQPGDTSQINQIIIGHQAEGFGSNTVHIGNSNTVVTVLDGSVAINKQTLSYANKTPDPSAVLDVYTGGNKGFLQPRMTTSNRDAIASPATGLSIYNTTTNFPNFWDGSGWQQVASQASISGAFLPITGGTLTGNLLFTDNTYDIGASGATRPRTGYFGTSVLAPLVNAATGFQIAGAATSGNYLRGNGTNFVSSAIQVGDVPALAYLPITGGTLTGHLLFTDNTYDIGASGLTRPRTGYFGTSVVSPIFNATTGFQIAGTAATGTILKANGTNFVASTETYAAPGTSGNVMTSDGTNWTSAAPAAAVVNLSLTGTTGTIELTNSAGTDIIYKTTGSNISLTKVAGTKDTLYVGTVEHWGEVSVSGGSTSVTAGTPERPDNDTPGTPTGNVSSEFTQSGSTITYIGASGVAEVTASLSFAPTTGGGFLISIFQEGVEIAKSEVRVTTLIGAYETVTLPTVTVAVSANDTFDIRIEPTAGSDTITVHSCNIYARKVY